MNELVLLKIIVNRVKIIELNKRMVPSYDFFAHSFFWKKVDIILSDLLWFIGVFLIVYIICFFLYIFKKGKKYNPEKVPWEVAFIVLRYKVDMKKVNYLKMINIISIMMSFNIALVFVLTFKIIKNIYVGMFVGAFLLLIVSILFLNILGNYYVRKGLVKNGNKKN